MEKEKDTSQKTNKEQLQQRKKKEWGKTISKQ